ncbi:hypothetical protein PR202_gb08011 [Eleusine coracana subsp. coracana]|uniref:DUF1409 domain-containing protein n=1 Tax=Eleusine coracana subsp. coracana TaxID=191504 RepID=A0AAV5ED08_ELECO|nr:hypothetical protein PR202_gb08011 [Eleusine coracana subsp. coracana]
MDLAPFTESSFPSENALENEEIPTHRCTSLGEAAMVIPGQRMTLKNFKSSFVLFYNGLQLDKRVWFPYHELEFENPSVFRPDNPCRMKNQPLSLKPALGMAFCLLTFLVDSSGFIHTNSTTLSHFLVNLDSPGCLPALFSLDDSGPVKNSRMHWNIIKSITWLERSRWATQLVFNCLHSAQPCSRIYGMNAEIIFSFISSTPAVLSGVAQEVISELAHSVQIPSSTPAVPSTQMDPTRQEESTLPELIERSSFMIEESAHHSDNQSSSATLSNIPSAHALSIDPDHIDTSCTEEHSTAPSVVPSSSVLDIVPWVDPHAQISRRTSSIILPPEVKAKLLQIRARLDEVPIEQLVLNATPIRQRYIEIKDMLPHGLASILHPTAFIEFHQFRVLEAKACIEHHLEQRNLAKAADKKAAKEQSKYISLVSKSADLEIKLDILKKEREELQATLEAKNKEIADVETGLAKVPKEIIAQEVVTTSAHAQSISLWDTASSIPGSTEEDTLIITEVDQLHFHAINMIDFYCPQE